METVKNAYAWLQERVAEHPAVTIWLAIGLILVAMLVF